MASVFVQLILPSSLLASAPMAAHAQLVPEGIHEEVSGPVELCGLRGEDVANLHNAAEASGEFRSTPIDSDRFLLFTSEDGLKQLVFTRPSEPAHPAATCRHAFQVADGSWHQERSMRCDASREACDRLFVEFQELDQRMADSLARAD